MNKISIAIIAGGRSQRMGQDKRRLHLWGDDQPNLLERTVNLAQQFSADVLVVLNDPEAWQSLNVRLIPDAVAEGGALGGLVTGLRHAQQQWTLILACDFPLLNGQFLQTLLDLPRTTQAIVPQLDASQTRNRAGWQPLCALYHRSCLPLFETALKDHQLNISRVVDQLDVLPVTVMNNRDALINLNTVDDLNELMRHVFPR